MTDAERNLRASARALEGWANTPDPAARTENGRKAFEDKFIQRARELHPDASPARQERAAKQLRKAHFKEMSAKSVAARRRGGANIQQTQWRAVEFPLFVTTPGGKMVSLTVKARYDAATDTFEPTGGTA